MGLLDMYPSVPLRYIYFYFDQSKAVRCIVVGIIYFGEAISHFPTYIYLASTADSNSESICFYKFVQF